MIFSACACTAVNTVGAVWAVFAAAISGRTDSRHSPSFKEMSVTARTTSMTAVAPRGPGARVVCVSGRASAGGTRRRARTLLQCHEHLLCLCLQQELTCCFQELAFVVFCGEGLRLGSPGATQSSQKPTQHERQTPRTQSLGARVLHSLAPPHTTTHTPTHTHNKPKRDLQEVYRG